MAGPSPLRRTLERLGVLAPAQVGTLAQAADGPAALVGVLRCSAPLASPIDGRPCAGYYYRATAAGSGRSTTGARQRPLRRATVYADGVSLELDDGHVELELPASDDLDGEAHAALVAADIPGFRAIETLLVDGQRVRVDGRLRRGSADGAAHMQVRAITPLKE